MTEDIDCLYARIDVRDEEIRRLREENEHCLNRERIAIEDHDRVLARNAKLHKAARIAERKLRAFWYSKDGDICFILDAAEVLKTILTLKKALRELDEGAP